MEYRPLTDEPKWAKYWEDNGTYRFDQQAPGKVFSIDTPPPTVSGKIHLGHIFSYTQAEVVARFKRMQGHNVFYPFGFDDNGLPTERLVEKELGITGSNTERGQFTHQCLEITAKYRQQFRELWQRVGLSADWNLEYSTISPLSRKISQKSFLDLLEGGHIVKKDTPALWCTECGTSVAQAEVDDKELDSNFHDLRFKLEDGCDLVVATTRPELLPSCVAVFVHPDDERYKSQIGKPVSTPLGKTVKIIADEKVDINKGSGAVMCCTYGDETDMYWANKYNLKPDIIISKKGKIVDDQTGESNSIKASRTKILERLDKSGDVLSSKPIKHNVGVHERCGTPIEILPIPQWFVNILPMKAQLLAAADKVQWHPEYMKARFVQWVEDLKWDWCISRQRFFGVPVPVWTSKKTGETILPSKDQLPVDPQSDLPKELPPNHTSDDILPDKDVLDTWATSSLTPEINAHWGESDDKSDSLLPMNLRPQAHDIIRTWAFYTIVKSLLHTGNIPWEHIMISGHVQAKKGEKISKSKGNDKLTPEQLIERYSADAVRYWACGSSLGKDTLFDEKEIEKGGKLVTKLLNAANFIFLNLKDFDTKESLDEENLEVADKWILNRVKEVTARMHGHIDNYEVGLPLKEFERFFWQDFCGYYLEMVKERVYAPEKHGEGSKKSAQFSLYHAFNSTLKLIAPYLPFVTEEIYQNYFKKYEHTSSVHLTKQKNGTLEKSPQDLEIDSVMADIIKIVDKVRQLKAQQGIRLGMPVESVIVEGKESKVERIEKNANQILCITRAKALKTIATENAEDLDVSLDL